MAIFGMCGLNECRGFENIRYLEQLLPYFVGLKFILHKKLIEDRIEDLKYRVQQEEIRDILDS